MNDNQQQTDSGQNAYDQLFTATPSTPAPGSAGPVSTNDVPQDDSSIIQPTTADEVVTTDENVTEPVPAIEESTVDEAPASAPAAPGSDELLDIKQDALQELSPLVGQLEQAPEDKFRTTMMMIQASDDHSLIKVAYEAAKQITDEKTRAQALLDVVNEINYFTQQNSSQQ